ncbi:MAG: BTAD domain-containing putative transcriptional regulator [Gemmatimonadota bacterium]
MIEIRTLGLGTVYKDGQELAGLAAQRQRFALLAYLAVEGRVNRDRLLTIFWPEREEEKGRHSLSQALYALRRELHEDCVQVEGDSVSVSSEICTVDVKRLEAAADDERWDEVVDRYTGVFLDQFTLSGAPEFEKWQSSNRARLARLARRAFRQVVEQQMAEGNLGDALPTASRWVTLQPLEDEAQHTLITLLARSGDRSGALKQYEAYRTLLARELDVEPLEGTVALVQRIKAGETPQYRPLSAVEQTEEQRASQPLDVREQAPGGAPEEAEAVLAPQPLSMGALMSELRRRRVFHVGAAYLAVAWLAIQFTGTLVEHALLPDWVFRVMLFFLLIGFPFAIILAWAREPHEIPGAPPQRRLWPHWAERVRGGQLFWVLSVMVLALLATWIVVERRLRGSGVLDSTKVVVFPFAVSPEGSEPVGENFATRIGIALQSSGLIRYEDGFYALAELGPADVTALTDRTAESRARALGAAFYIRGRILLTSDSVQLHVELHDVAGDSILFSELSTNSIDETWEQRESERIVGRLLAALAPDEPLVQLEMPSDTPAAVAQFLEGERAYRRAQFGLALEHYQEAVRLDSTFAYAALKGYLAATWERDTDAALELMDVAAKRRIFLEPSLAAFQQGLLAYVSGQTDSAASHFQRALTIAPDWPEAWAQLGELYYHFILRASPLDSLAEAALQEARRQDRTFAPPLYHLIQLAIRNGDLQQAERLLREFRQVQPDTTHVWLPSVELMLECVRQSPVMVDWRSHAKQDPASVYDAAQALAVGGLQADCARAAWTALLEHDTATDDSGYNRRFWALMGLHSLLVAEARLRDASDLLESDTTFSYIADDVYILDAAAGADLEIEASEAVEHVRQRLSDNTAYYTDLWFLGIWEARQGRVDEVRALADTLDTIAAETDNRAARLMAQSLQARATLASGDSAGALELLRELVPTKRRLDPWYPWESLAAEQLALAELLYARGDFEEAARVAANFDAPARPTTDLRYLPASLALRVRAARQLGDAALEQRCRDRLAALGRTDLLEGPPN